MRNHLTILSIHQNGEVNFIVEVEPHDVIESDFEQHQPNIVVSAASSPRKGAAAVRSAVALQGEPMKECIFKSNASLEAQYMPYRISY